MVTQHKMIIDGDSIRPGKTILGGIHFRGHCDSCNSTIGGRYDNAYADFAAILRPSWVKDWNLQLPPRIAVNDGTFLPGSVVRSLTLGLCAFSPWLQTEFPEFTRRMLGGSRVQLPGDLRLFIALARGRTGRTSGSFAGLYLVGPKAQYAANGYPIGINSVGSCYFPPLAWELVHENHCVLPSQGWVDVSEWTEVDPTEEHMVHEYFSDLPSVAHPRHTPSDHDNWAELYAPEFAPLVESPNVEGGMADSLTRRMLANKALVRSDEIERLVKRQQRN